MNGKPGIVILTDDAGTWTAGDAALNLNGTNYVQSFSTDKDTSMTAWAAAIEADANVDSAVYDNGAHTITITPVPGAALSCLLDLHLITGTMTIAIETQDIALWASDGAALIDNPDTPKQETGFLHDERPPAEWFNWLFNLMILFFRWIANGCFHNCYTINNAFWNYCTTTPSTFNVYSYKKSDRQACIILNDSTVSANTLTGYLTIGDSTTYALPASHRPNYGSPIGIILIELTGSVFCPCYVKISSSGIIVVTKIDGMDFAANEIVSIQGSVLSYEQLV
jgi:hypothetical protein